MIKLIQQMAVKHIQDAKQVHKQAFPYTQFEFMHWIHHEHLEMIEAQGWEFIRKSVLPKYIKIIKITECIF